MRHPGSRQYKPPLTSFVGLKTEQEGPKVCVGPGKRKNCAGLVEACRLLWQGRMVLWAGRCVTRWLTSGGDQNADRDGMAARSSLDQEV